MVSVPKLCPDNGTVVCIGSGPSLTAQDVDLCRGRGLVIAINDAVRLAPFADVLWACDRKWWQAHPETDVFPGLKYSLQFVPGREDVLKLKNTGDRGLELEPTGVRTGKNSGYQAVNCAVHLGATRILLLGYDMQPDAKGRTHFCRTDPRQGVPEFSMFINLFASIVEPLKAHGVQVVNCTPGSALPWFLRQSLAEALAAEEVAA